VSTELLDFGYSRSSADTQTRKVPEQAPHIVPESVLDVRFENSTEQGQRPALGVRVVGLHPRIASRCKVQVACSRSVDELVHREKRIIGQLLPSAEDTTAPPLRDHPPSVQHSDGAAAEQRLNRRATELFPALSHKVQLTRVHCVGRRESERADRVATHSRHAFLHTNKGRSRTHSDLHSHYRSIRVTDARPLPRLLSLGC
jgi:hypothetical protein